MADTGESSAHRPEPAPVVTASKASAWDFVRAFYNSGCVRLLPMLFAYIAGFGIILPYVPLLMVNFYASRHAGHAMHCEDFEEHDKPQACIIGSDTLVQWSSTTSFFTNTILLFFLSPLTGTWSDMVGRKPFLLIGQTLAMVPKLVLLFYFTSGMSLIYYYPADIVNGAISPVVVSLAYIADALAPEHRAAGFGMVLGVFAAGIAATPKIGSLLGAERAVYLGVGLKVFGLLYTKIFIHESITPEKRALARQAMAERTHEALQPLGDVGELRERGVNQSPLRVYLTGAGRLLMRVTAIRYTVNGLSIVVRNSEFIKLTLALMVSAWVSNGLSDVDSQYFVTVFNFHSSDFANFFVIFGVGTLIVQVFLMQPILAYLGEKPCLVIAFTAIVVKSLGLAFAPDKNGIYASLVVGTLGVMSFPSVSSIKANAVPDHEQGAVQGALSGAQAVAQGLGPLVFAQLFRFWTQASNYWPRGVPLVAACISLIPLGLMMALDLPKLERWKQQWTSALDEPLLPDGAADIEALTGHGVMSEEGGVAHKEADLMQGMFVEGHTLHGKAKHSPMSSSAVQSHSTATAEDANSV